MLLARAADPSPSQQAKRGTDNNRRGRERKDIVARPAATKYNPPGRAWRSMRHDRLPVARKGGKPVVPIAPERVLTCRRGPQRRGGVAQLVGKRVGWKDGGKVRDVKEWAGEGGKRQVRCSERVAHEELLRVQNQLFSQARVRPVSPIAYAVLTLLPPSSAAPTSSKMASMSALQRTALSAEMPMKRLMLGSRKPLSMASENSHPSTRGAP